MPFKFVKSFIFDMCHCSEATSTLVKYERDIISFVWRIHEIMSPCTGTRVNSSYKRIASRGSAWFRNLDLEISRHRQFLPFTAVVSVRTIHQNGMAPGKRDNTQPNIASLLGLDVSQWGYPSCPLTVMYLNPMTDTAPATTPTSSAPHGWTIMSAEVPMATPPASVAFWTCTWKRNDVQIQIQNSNSKCWV